MMIILHMNDNIIFTIFSIVRLNILEKMAKENAMGNILLLSGVEIVTRQFV